MAARSATSRHAHYQSIIIIIVLLFWSILLYVLRLHIFFQYRIETVAPTAFYTMTLLASLGIVFALICLSFNLVKRKLKYIKKTILLILEELVLV